MYWLNLASNQGVLEAILPTEKQPEREVDHSLLRMAKFYTARRLNYTFLCLHAVVIK